MADADGYPIINTADGGLILTVYPPEGRGRPLTFDAVRAEIEQLGITQVKWEDVKHVVDKRSGLPVVINQPQSKSGDAQIFVEITEDEMEARVTVVPPEQGGSPATLDKVKAALASNGVVFGLIEDALKAMEGPITAMTDPNEVYEPVEALVAKGKPVIHGTDAIVEKYYEKKADVPQVNEAGIENKNARVDYRNMNTIENVEVGALLAKKIDATAGEPGMTVTGTEIFPEEGKDIELKPGEGVKLDEADNSQFIATETGQVVMRGGFISVLALYELDGDVTMKVGNIDFIGTVIIHGSVNGEYKIKAGQDVLIDGVLDGGEVEAGGKVVVKGGVIGAKTRIKAEGNVEAKYVRNAYVESGGIVTITDAAMHSTIVASEKVELTGKGLLVGGSTIAGWEVIAKEIGAKMNTPTEIEVGEDPRVREEMQHIERETKVLVEQLDKAKKGIDFLKLQSKKLGGKLPDQKKELLSKLTKTQFKLLGDLKRFQTRKTEIEHKQEQLKGKKRAKVSCTGLIYAGTKITVSKAARAVSEEMKYCSLVEDNTQIKVVPFG